MRRAALVLAVPLIAAGALVLLAVIAAGLGLSYLLDDQ